MSHPVAALSNSFTPPSLERLSHGEQDAVGDVRTLFCGKALTERAVYEGSYGHSQDSALLERYNHLATPP